MVSGNITLLICFHKSCKVNGQIKILPGQDLHKQLCKISKVILYRRALSITILIELFRHFANVLVKRNQTDFSLVSILVSLWNVRCERTIDTCTQSYMHSYLKDCREGWLWSKQSSSEVIWGDWLPGTVSKICPLVWGESMCQTHPIKAFKGHHCFQLLSPISQRAPWFKSIA